MIIGTRIRCKVYSLIKGFWSLWGLETLNPKPSSLLCCGAWTAGNALKGKGLGFRDFQTRFGFRVLGFRAFRV